MAAGKRSPSLTPQNLTVRDNVPEGCVVSLEGIRQPLSFAAMFREELMARGYGIPLQEVRRERKGVD